MARGLLSQLYLTDFDRLKARSDVDRSEMWEGRSPLSADETAYERMVCNAKVLVDLGAQAEMGEPFNRVTGWEICDGDEERLSGLRSPASLQGGDPNKLQLLFWGSPHPNASANWSETYGPSPDSQYKCEAFESMAWKCSGTVMMTFPAKYNVEFLQPLHHFFDERPADRILPVSYTHLTLPTKA